MYLQPAISEASAQKELAKKAYPLGRKRKIVKTELFYLPLYIFRIKVGLNPSAQSEEQVGIDGIRGEFAFFKDEGGRYQPASPCQQYDFRISESQARQIALHEYERHLFKLNLKNRAFAKIEACDLVRCIFYPYWLGYFQRGTSLDFDVLDAVSGKPEGTKMRSLFMQLLVET